MKNADPLKLAKMLWPDTNFYRQQRDIFRSVWDDLETVVVAGNELGKDYVAAHVVLLFFLTRTPCRIITTSVKDDHLVVLWDEIKRAITSSKFPLEAGKGGTLVVLHRSIRKIVHGVECPMSYVKGMVAAEGAAMQGHHADSSDGTPRNLFVVDEASGVPDEYYKMADTWAKRKLIFGNPWPCANFFRRAVDGNPETNDPGGTIMSKDGKICYRRVIKITAEDSQNVQLARAQLAAGVKVTNETLTPGVKSWEDYKRERILWDKIRQSVSLDGKFFVGAEVLLYPPDWLDAAERMARQLEGQRRVPESIGLDSAAGGDNTAWAVCDRLGLLKIISKKTVDTAEIFDETVRLMREYKIAPEKVLLDVGGGGQQHADYLHRADFAVQTVNFGGAVLPQKKRGLKTFDQRVAEEGDRLVYANRRAELYGTMRRRLDPAYGNVFALPPEIVNRPRRLGEPSLRRQMAPIPLQYDDKGRMILPLKRRKDAQDKRQTLTELVGCSPDELEALLLGVYALERRTIQSQAGVAC